MSNNFDDLTNSIQELTLLSRIVHPNIIKIHNYMMLKEDKPSIGVIIFIFREEKKKFIISIL